MEEMRRVGGGEKERRNNGRDKVRRGGNERRNNERDEENEKGGGEREYKKRRERSRARPGGPSVEGAGLGGGRAGGRVVPCGHGRTTQVIVHLSRNTKQGHV